MSTLICPNCKCQSKSGELFCSKCGTNLESVTLSCKGCGMELNTEDEFCGKCGKRVKSNMWWWVAIVVGLVLGFFISAGLNYLTEKNLEGQYAGGMN